MGSFRSTPELTKHTFKASSDKITYAVSHMCGWRLYMEDAHISISPYADKQGFSLFGVFDGHGGAEVAQFVSRHFPDQLKKNPYFNKGDYQTALKETFLRMDVLLIQDMKKEPRLQEIKAIQKKHREADNGPKYEEESHAGCTANVILITPEFVYCANAGDSRSAALIDAQTVEFSYDHKPENPKEIERIKKAGGTVSFGRVNGGLNLSRALGDLQYKSNSNLKPQEQMISPQPDIIKKKNQNISYIIMGCDGIWEVKSCSEMLTWINKRLGDKNQEQVLEELLDELISKDSGNQCGMDNMSTILIRFK